MRKGIGNYTYNFEPEMYKYILSTNILNKKKDEHKIFKSLKIRIKDILKTAHCVL